MLAQKMLLLYHSKDLILNYYLMIFWPTFWWKRQKHILLNIISEELKSMMSLAVVMLSLRGLWIISDPGDDFGSFFSGDSIAAGIGLKKVLKSFLSAGTGCWNSSCCIRSRWWLDCCHFIGGNMRILIYFRAIKYFRRSWKNLLLIFEIKRICFVCENKTV